MKDEESIPPLMAESGGRVRFQEVDSLGIAWHGHYASFFEDGRIAFGDRYGLRYHCFMEQRTPAPVVQLHCDYRHPLRFDERYRVETTLHWREAARIDFTYRVLNSEGRLCAEGNTVQLLTDAAGELLLYAPPWLESFRDYWRQGDWKKGPWRMEA